MALRPADFKLASFSPRLSLRVFDGPFSCVIGLVVRPSREQLVPARLRKNLSKNLSRIGAETTPPPAAVVAVVERETAWADGGRTALSAYADLSLMGHQ
jgi:hypothetical protein